MRAALPPPETLPTVAADGGRAFVERQLALLGRLAEAGLEIAVALEGQAQGQAKGGEAVVQGDIAMAYSRVSRAVRQTVMLQSRLIEEQREREAGQAGRKAAARAGAARIVRRVIEDDRANDAAKDTERAERLAGEAAERLREEDFGDLLSRPFAEAVADIVRDLGLEPDWLAFAQDCFAAEAGLDGKAGPMDGGPDAPPFDIRWLNEDQPPGDGSSSAAPTDWRRRRLGRWSP